MKQFDIKKIFRKSWRWLETASDRGNNFLLLNNTVLLGLSHGRRCTQALVDGAGLS